MIKVCNLSFSYTKEKVLDGANISIESGSLYTLIGLNGAGKSTLFGCLTKSLDVPNGTIFIRGMDINSFSYREYSKLVSYVPQLNAIRMNDCVVRDYMVEGRTPYLSIFSVPGENEYEVVENVARKVGIEKLLGTSFSELSGGQQQLVSIARALVQDTPILILDEPMSALDLCNQTTILKLIATLVKDGRTVLFSTHNPNHAIALGAGMIFLKDGRIIRQKKAGSPIYDEDIYDIYGESVVLSECNGINTVVFNTGLA